MFASVGSGWLRYFRIHLYWKPDDLPFTKVPLVKEKQCRAVPPQSDVWNVPLPRSMGCYAGCRLFANGTMKKRTCHYPSVAFLVVFISTSGHSVIRFEDRSIQHRTFEIMEARKLGYSLAQLNNWTFAAPADNHSAAANAERVERLAGVANKFRGVQHDGVQFGTRWLKIGTVGIRRNSEIRYEGLEILGGEPKPDFEKCRGANQNRNDFKVWINATNCRTGKFKNSPFSMYSERRSGNSTISSGCPTESGSGMSGSRRTVERLGVTWNAAQELEVALEVSQHATVQADQHVVPHHEISHLNVYGLPAAGEIHQRKEGFAFEEIHS
ncbi:hypothetical protein DFH08DRAFT_1031055 [Mycena albidolilacea]|uniref:Uncharacterized protein n=1 Tax=Mycena albidolilacea TaxID=1033008 RepID=A0AAD7AJN2_9AGAR|nr:hypothetical protein DFH08DRAFT_1031055 [Mycena albidolilacea]